jgi:hypothetical protein
MAEVKSENTAPRPNPVEKIGTRRGRERVRSVQTVSGKDAQGSHAPATPAMAVLKTHVSNTLDPHAVYFKPSLICSF